MDCRRLKDELRIKLGAIGLSDSERTHLAECPDCADYYKDLLALEKPLKEMATPAMTIRESVLLNERLDAKIELYKTRGIRPYRLATGLGTLAVTILLVVFISFWNRYSIPETISQSGAGQSGYVLATDSAINNIVGSIDSSQFAILARTDDEAVDSSYYLMAIDSYVQRVGSGAGELILGEISDEELEYLKDQIDWSDIL
jgi:hypothetical protein